MHDFIENLKQDKAGLIFWLNLCAHYGKDALDTTVAKDVFQKAQTKFISSHGTSTMPEPGAAIYSAICVETAENTVAIAAMRNVQDVDWNQIQEINTVINDTSWWGHYAEVRSNGHKDVLDELSNKIGILTGYNESDLGKILLQKCWEEDKKELHELFGESLKNGSLKTSVNRFWASLQSGTRPTQPETLIDTLGLSSFKQGQWLIEIVYDINEIRKLIAGDATKHFKRPSALCVNDRIAPRFRALSPDEIGTPSGSLSWHGWTVDLSQWASRSTNNMNGLPELICPSVLWGHSHAPSAIRLAGKVETPANTPNNQEYADYLQQLFSSTLSQEAAFIAALA